MNEYRFPSRITANTKRSLKTKTHPMFVPLGKTVLTPWPKDSQCVNSAKGIRIDNMDVSMVAKSNVRPSNLCYSNISFDPWQEE